MKFTKLEGAALVITFVALALMGGFFMGARSGAQPVHISSQSAPPSSASAAPGGSQSPEPAPAASPSTQPDTPPDGTQDAPARININTATAEELQQLPGIGAARAQAIVEYRAGHGPFTYVEDLRNVSGIGEGILAGLMDYATTGE